MSGGHISHGYVDTLPVTDKMCLDCPEELIPLDATVCPRCGSKRLLAYHEEDAPTPAKKRRAWDVS